MASGPGRQSGIRDDGGQPVDAALDLWVATWGPDGPIGPPLPLMAVPPEHHAAFIQRADSLARDHRLFRAFFQAAGPEQQLRPAPALGKAGRYLLEREVRAGGMGEVFLARDLEVNRRVAYKVRKEGLSDHLKARFDHEAAITDKVRQPGVVPIYGRVEDDSGRPAYVMEYVEGLTLAEVLDDADHSKRVETIGHVLEACRIVAHAHALGIVHLDLSLKNLLIGNDGRTRVLDWGLARELDCEHDVGPRPPRPGTPAFQGPSGVAGLPPSFASDVHCLGVVLDRVRAAGTPRVNAGSLAAIIAKAKSSSPDDRYRDAGALADDLARLLADEPIRARRQTAGERWGRLVRRHSKVVALVTVLGFLASVSMVIATVLFARARHSDSLAREHATKADIARRAAEAHTQTVLSMVRERLGSWGPQGYQLDAIASRELENLLPFLRALRGSRPEDREVLANLAWVTGALGLAEYRNDHRPRALVLLSESAEIAEALMAADPDDSQARRLTLEALVGLLEAQHPRVHVDDFPDQFLATCDKYERDLGPRITPQETQSLARWRLSLADELTRRGRMALARSIATAVREEAKRTLPAGPNDHDWLVLLDTATNLLDEHQEHVAFLREVIASSRRADQARMAFVVARAADLERDDDPEAARLAASEALDLGLPVVTALERWVEPAAPAAWVWVLRFERLLAKSAVILGHNEQAVALKQAADRLLHRFATRYPELAPPNHWLVFTQLNHSHFRVFKGTVGASPDMVGPLVQEVLEAFAGVDPDQTPSRSSQLSLAFCALAFRHHMLGDVETAAMLRDKARSILETNGPEAPNDPAPHLAWAEFWTLSAKARIRSAGPIELVLEDRRRAVKETGIALELDPDNHFIQGRHVDRKTRLSRTLAEMGRYDDALTTLADIDSLLKDVPEHSRMMADLFQKTAQAILEDGRGPLEERREVAERFRDLARASWSVSPQGD